VFGFALSFDKDNANFTKIIKIFYEFHKRQKVFGVQNPDAGSFYE